MRECIHSKFLLDGQVMNCSGFQPNLINKGISIYEVIRLIKNHLLFFEDHLQRLELSVKLAEVDSLHTRDVLTRMIQHLISLNKISNGNIKIVFNYQDNIKRHCLVYFIPPNYPLKVHFQRGIEVVTYPFTRENPHKKMWLPDFRSASDALIQQKKIFEVLIVNGKNQVTEASRSNFFAIKNGTVFTPPVECVLPGITRKYVINICREQKIPFFEKEIPVNSLGEYDAAFITSTSSNVLPVAKIDNLIFGVDDPVMRKLMKEFDNLVERERGREGEGER
jgi:branched-chain amino acid aminotransferase